MRTQGIELYIGAKISGELKHKITAGRIFKVELQSMLFSDRIVMAGPFAEIKAHSLSFRQSKASEKYLMSTTQTEWTVFVTGFVLGKPVFSFQSYAAPVERPHLHHSD